MPWTIVCTGMIAVLSIKGRVGLTWVTFVPNIEMGVRGISYREFLEEEDFRLSDKSKEIDFKDIEDWEWISDRASLRGAEQFPMLHQAEVISSINKMRQNILVRECQDEDGNP